MKKTLKFVLSFVLVIALLLSSLTIISFANNDASSRIITDDVSITGNGTVGDLFVETLTSTSNFDTGDYEITDLEVNDKDVSIEFVNEDTCKVIVALYDEKSSEMITSTYVEVPANAEAVDVTFPSDNVPEYFFAKAFLVNESGAALCNAYCDFENTKAYEEFSNKTVNDFNKTHVLNLDSDATNNFAVLNASAIVIAEDDKTNIYSENDSKDGIYVFKQIDDKIKTLKSGNIICYRRAEIDKTLLVKIKSINIKGSVATITEDSIDITEAFDYVKIDTTKPQVRANAFIDEEGTYPFETKVEPIDKTFGNVKINGSITLKVGIEFKLFIDKNFFNPINWGEDIDVFLRFKVTPVAELTLSVTGKLNEEIALLPLKASLYEIITVEIASSLVINVSGEITVTGILTFSLGTEWSTGNGFTNLSEKPTFKPIVKIEGSFYFGLKLVPKLYVINENALSVNITSSTGAQIDVKLSQEHADDGHECIVCFEGKIVGKIKASANLIFAKGIPFIEFTPSQELLNKTIPITDFYWSVSHQEFGWGICPYRKTSTPTGNFDFLGDAKVVEDNAVELTPLDTWRGGGIWYNKKVDTSDSIRVNFSIWAGGGRNNYYGGADGIILLFSNTTYNLGELGGYLGFVNDTALGIEFDSYCGNSGDPNGKHIAVVKNNASNHLEYVLDDRVDDSSWHDVSVYIEYGKVKVFFDNALVLKCDYENFLSDSVYVGFAASTGAGYNRQLIKDFKIIKGEETVVIQSQSVSDFEESQKANMEVLVQDNEIYFNGISDSRYMLYSVLNNNEDLDVTPINLKFINQAIAKDGKVEMNFYPTEDTMTILVGDFGSGIETKVLSFRYEEKKINSVSIGDITMNYKNTAKLNPQIDADEGAEYTVEYKSSNTKIATVDNNGNVTAKGRGDATITVTVTDSNGNTVTDTCKVTVKYTWWQWILVIVLFGWIWY